MERLPVSGPWISPREIAYVTDAVTNAWYGDANMYHERFERAFREYVGTRHAVALPSCTSALHLSLLALGIGPGDEVVVPEITWIASAAPVTYVGATTVFADVNPHTWCLSAESLQACITPRTKAVIPVDLYGGMPDYAAIRAVSAQHGLAVIEDAAQAIGAVAHGARAGSLGDTGTFSFHGSKTLTTGEGGMLVTDREDVYQRVLHLRDHGRDPAGRMFWNTEVGYKYRMSAMQAALGLAQIERVDELIGHKRQIFAWYEQELADVPGLTLNAEAAGTTNTYWMVTVILNPELGIDKEQLGARLATEGIDTRPFFYPLSSMPAYSDQPAARSAREHNRTAYALSPYGLNLPSGMTMTAEKVTRVCQALKGVMASRPTR
jgi:perosamine synthetase